MSAYDQQMTQDNSSQSVSSRGGSESGSQYQLESGFYMSSYAATVFITGLITIGMLMITLVIALSMMLQSCQTQSSGIIENHKSYYYNHDYCKITLHMELNQLNTVQLPSICKVYAVNHINEGRFLRDLNFSISLAEKHFSSFGPPKHDFTVMLMDIDDIFPSKFQHRNKTLKNSYSGSRDCIKEARNSRCMLMLRLYDGLQKNGWPLILITRRGDEQRDIITKYLVSAGYTGWVSLIMRSADEAALSNLEYFTRRMAAKETKGYHIAGVISSRLDALAGLYVGNCMFKVSNMLQNVAVN